MKKPRRSATAPQSATRTPKREGKHKECPECDGRMRPHNNGSKPNYWQCKECGYRPR